MTPPLLFSFFFKGKKKKKKKKLGCEVLCWIGWLVDFFLKKLLVGLTGTQGVFFLF
jgi:hypothetical protein